MANTKTLVTGSWVRVATTSSANLAELTAVFYDEKAHPIRTYVSNHLGGYTVTDSKLDFFGKTLYTISKHKRNSASTELTVREDFTYSPQDRLLTHTHQINGGTVQLLADNTYDALGQLESKKVGNISGNPLQKVDFKYNIRGWLTSINKIDDLQQNTDPRDLFAFKINYDQADWDSNAAKALYNGNIAETKWITGSDNNGIVRGYGYLYDKLNRLKEATYQTPSLTDNQNYFGESMDYDKNGNINHLWRKNIAGTTANPYVGGMDDLTYVYKNDNSNQLAKVTDGLSGNDNEGFIDGNKTGDDYDYDDNGNLILDKNKDITAISYNQLNLPKKITFGSGNTIEYIYNAAGQKLEKIVKEGTTTATTNYLGGFQYKDDALEFFPTAEGYVKNDNGAFSYVFQYKDHLGNIRLSYAENPSTHVLEINDENNYYPFGLKHKGYNDYVGTNNKYRFQGQECQDELGLNWDSFKYRNYDPAIGRFMSIDPLTEKYKDWAPYVFSGNRVIDSRELEGLEPYVVTGRAFIPMKTVPNPMASISNTKSFKGDTRNNYDVNAKSFRTEQIVKVDFDNNKVTTLNNTASPSVGYDKSGKVVETSHAEKAGPNPTYTPGTMKDGSTTINMQVDASNKLVDGAPAINYDVNITLKQQNDGSLDYKISGSSDGFPAYEFFITNQATGDSTLIYGSNPNKTGDSPSSLFPPMEKNVSGKGNIPVKEEEKKK